MMEATKREGIAMPVKFPEMVGTIEVEYALNRQLEASKETDPLKDEAFMRFAPVLGSERFLVLLDYTRASVDHSLRCWLLARGFVEAIKPLTGDLGPRTGVDLVDHFFGILVDVIPAREDPNADYVKWAEATQPLGFEGVTVLEEVTAKLLDRAREIALADSAKDSL